MDRSKLLVALALVFTVFATLLGIINIGIASTQSSYASDTSSFFVPGGPGIALIELYGVIQDGRYGPVAADRIVQQLEDARNNPAIYGVILNINSPGGAVGATKKIYDAVRELRKSKRVVAIVSDVAASGGYYVAAAADRILAYPGSIIGSIGVIMIRPDVSGLLEKYGIRIYALKAGKHKDMSYPFRGLSDEELRIYQKMLDDAYEAFKADVREGRKQSIKTVDSWAEGSVYSGREAERLQMIDDFGGLKEAVAWIAQEEKKSPKDFQILRAKRSFWEEILQESGMEFGVRSLAGRRDFGSHLSSPMLYLYEPSLKSAGYLYAFLRASGGER